MKVNRYKPPYPLPSDPRISAILEYLEMRHSVKSNPVMLNEQGWRIVLADVLACTDGVAHA